MVVLKIVGPAVCLLLPVPMGLFTPCFVAGATVGWTFSNVLGLGQEKGNLYAAVGAACLASGSTKVGYLSILRKGGGIYII